MGLVLVLGPQPTTNSDSVPVSAYVDGRPDLGDFDGSSSETELVGALSSIFGPEVARLLFDSAVAMSDSLSVGDQAGMKPGLRPLP
jgi:hypothetical protein